MPSDGASAFLPPRDVHDIEELLDSVDDQILFWDTELRLVFANRAVLRWLGSTLDRVRGLRFVDLVGTNVAE